MLFNILVEYRNNFNIHRGYKLCYIYCSDCSENMETGFDVQKPDDTISDEELNKVTSRLVTMIARVKYYLNVPEVLLKLSNGLKIINVQFI